MGTQDKGYGTSTKDLIHQFKQSHFSRQVELSSATENGNRHSDYQRGAVIKSYDVRQEKARPFLTHKGNFTATFRPQYKCGRILEFVRGANVNKVLDYTSIREAVY